MIAEYLQAALRHAVYEQIEDGTYFGYIAELPGSWAHAATLEECVAEMRTEAEEWLLFAIAMRDDLPKIDGYTLIYPRPTA